MSKQVNDLTNKMFGDLKVLRAVERPVGSKASCMFWLCVCTAMHGDSICGKMKTVSAQNLITGNTQSCGCKARSDSSTGVQNVYWHKARQRYLVRLTANRRPYHIGTFNSLEEAIAAKEMVENAIETGNIKTSNPRLREVINTIRYENKALKKLRR